MKLPYEYIETEPYEKGFADYYKEHIVPLSLKCEQSRKFKKKQYKFNILLAILTGGIDIVTVIKSAWFIKFASSARKGPGQLLLLIPIVTWWLIVRRPKVQYFSTKKAEFVPKILKFFGDFQYREKSYLIDETISKHKYFLPTANIWKGEDYISYENNKINVQILERTSKNFFKHTGQLFLVLKFPMDLKMDLLIGSKNVEHFKMLFNQARKRRNLKTFDGTCNKSNQLFYIAAKNKNMVNTLLSNEVVSMLEKFNEVFQNKGLIFSVIDNQIFVKLNTYHNLFEVGQCYNNPIANANAIKNFIRELHYTKKLVDEIIQTVVDKHNDTMK